jgi:hypothetical protein
MTERRNLLEDGSWMSDREHQVRECAYYFWEAEGRPQGRAQMHWTMAEIATTLFGYLNATAGKQAASQAPAVAPDTKIGRPICRAAN